MKSAAYTPWVDPPAHVPVQRHMCRDCQHCYAERVASRFSGPGMPYEGLIHPSTKGWNGKVLMASRDTVTQPIRWQRPRRIFVNSMSDLFHESVPDDWIDSIFGVMWACLYTRHEQTGHVFQILTKRPERMLDYLSTDRREAWATAAVNYGGGIDPDGLYDQTAGYEGPHPRIWLGVSVENQATADERIPLLLQCPATVRWLSCEPLLGPVGLWPEWLHTKPSTHRVGINWVVTGGESGTGARPMHPDWARSLRNQCAAASVPYFFKQWGEWLPVDTPSDEECFAEDGSDRQLGGRVVIGRAGNHPVARVGKKYAGRLLDGVEHNAYPVAAR